MIRLDLAQRLYNHTWKLDPIIRSLLDTDFYKLLMLQMVWERFSNVNVTFSLINRMPNVLLANQIEEKELRDQLDYAKTLRFSKAEMIWLRGNSFYGKEQIFKPPFLSWLENFQLPDYDLQQHNGQYHLTFSGPWCQTMMWEVPALAIINELRSRAALKNFGLFDLDIIYARAKTKLWTKIERLRALPKLSLSDFGTRRRHSFLWQRWCVHALREHLGTAFTGTSNVLLAMDTGLEAVGTNAHELPMVMAALAETEEEIKNAPYRIMQQWQHYYDGNLLIALPDTFGSAAFFANAPAWVKEWTGFRLDSLPPLIGAERVLDWWHKNGVDPKEKILLFSDALTVENMEETYQELHDKVRIFFGWGTNLTNDFANCGAESAAALSPISLVCKVTEVNGKPAVKLSDNISKETGEEFERKRYVKIFGQEGRLDNPLRR